MNKDIEKLYDHAKIANEEMGFVKSEIKVIKNDINWLKEKLERVDTRIWWIFTGVLLGILTQILIALK